MENVRSCRGFNFFAERAIQGGIVLQIAVTGEGPADYGKRDYNTREWLEGTIQQYMQKVATEIIGEEETEAIEFPPRILF